MNFLAHAWLAAPDPARIAGGVIGDWIKGPVDGVAMQALPLPLRDGVRLHRAIDAFAETHPAFRRSRQRIAPARRRYAGVIVDILYDHILARHWHDWHDVPLAEFVAGIYRTTAGLDGLPPTTAAALARMADEDWLGSYADDDGIRAILARMARRTRQPNPLADGFDDYADGDRAGLDADCAAFLRDARAFALAWSPSVSAKAPP